MGEDEEADGSPSFLNTGTAEPQRSVAYESVSAAGTSSFLEAKLNQYEAMAPDGTALQGSLLIAVRNGPLPEGDGVFGSNSCLIAADGTVDNG